MKTALAVCAACLLSFLLLITVAPVVAQTPAASPKVGASVMESLTHNTWVRVVIALTEPPSLAERPLNLEKVRREIARLREQVIVAVGDDLRQGHPFTAVPAIVGTVNAQGLQKLAFLSEVRKVDLDVAGRGHLPQSVPLVRADQWRARSVSGSSVSVAVLDTGVAVTQDDVTDDLIDQTCFLDTDGTIDGFGGCPDGSDRQTGAGSAVDGIYHGTFVSGIITSRGSISSYGVAPSAKIVAVKVLDDNPPAGRFYYFSEIVAALDYVLTSRPDVRVINMSLGTDDLFSGNCDNSTSYNMSGASVISSLRIRGAIAFASSGNDSSSTQMGSPACLSQVVSVGATTKSDVVASYTNSNSTLDLMAPGSNITSTSLDNTTETASGTSFASPHAAGCAALFIDGAIASTPDQIESLLKASTVQVTDPKNGLSFPRIDCFPTITITSFSPTSGSVGTSIVLNGTYFNGATSVKFNGTPSSNYFINSATQITATVPSGATSGAITVTTPSGTGSSNSFTVIPSGGYRFYPVTPCRIIDTRNTTVPLLSANVAEGFVVHSGGLTYNYSSQGGNPSGCGLPTDAKAVFFNFVAVNPTSSGYFQAWAFGSPTPTASILNYATIPNFNIANGIILPICNTSVATCTKDLNVQANQGNIQLVVDVVGYFK